MIFHAWLSDALVNVGEGIDETPVEEYVMMLEVTMADHPGWPCPPMFSWNVGMAMHVLKSDPVLRKLEHMQVDGLGTAYLFFYDKRGHQGLGQDTVYATQAHVEEAFSQTSMLWHVLPTLPLVSDLLWRHGSEWLLPLTAKG